MLFEHFIFHSCIMLKYLFTLILYTYLLAAVRDLKR